MDVNIGGVEFTNELVYGEAPKSVQYEIKDAGTYSVQFGYRYFRKGAGNNGFDGVALSNKVDFVVTAE